MPTEIKDLHINRVSLVKKPANGRRFLLFKSAGDDMEIPVEDDSITVLAKGLAEIVQRSLELIGNDEAGMATAADLADLLESGGDQAVAGAVALLSSIHSLHAMLAEVSPGKTQAASPPVTKQERPRDWREETARAHAVLDRLEADFIGKGGEINMDIERTAFEREVDRRAAARISKGEQGTEAAIRAKVIKELAGERPDLYELHREEMRKR